MIEWSCDEAGVTIGYTAHLISQEGQREKIGWNFKMPPGGTCPMAQ